MPKNLLIDGDIRFARGANSYADYDTLPQESFVFTVNMLNRGGALQARPGFDLAYTLPDGELQAATVFYPNYGLPQHVVVVSGQLYTSDYPYKSFHKVPGATMSPYVTTVYLEQTLKYVERNLDGSLTLVTPKMLLMIQDGVTPASYYDGHTVQRVSGSWKTPLGTHMKFAGGRLWVARDNLLFASDIADPLCFYEQTYNTLGGVSFYAVPEPVTGFALTPGTQSPQLLCFTANTTTMFRCDVRDRASWAALDSFQHLILPGIGCVSHRAITQGLGQLWWYAQTGWVSLDTAAMMIQSTKTRFADNEMIRSKSRLSPDLSGIAATTFENLILVSVPHADKTNTHTWVMDLSTIDLLNEELPPSWSGIWTGPRPVQWLHVTIDRTNLLFCASKDGDGKNRVYKGFSSAQRDSGIDFPWKFVSRGYSWGTKTLKHFRYLEFALSELQGQVDLKWSWAGGSRGPWKPFSTCKFFASEGSLDAAKEIEYTSQLFGLKKQSRRARTEDVQNMQDDSLASAGVEGQVFGLDPDEEHVDTSIQICGEGSGPCAVRALRLFAEPRPESATGLVVEPEADDRFVRYDGASSRDLEDLDADAQTWTSTQRYEAKLNKFVGAASATVTSRISQADADKRATQLAAARANRKLASIYPPIVGGSELP